MKKEYTKPQTVVVELKMTTQVLVSSVTHHMNVR